MAADRPWYRQVTTGYVLKWDDDYMVIDGKTTCRMWSPDKKLAVKLPRVVAFAIAKGIFDLPPEIVVRPTGKIRILRRYKVIP